MGTLDLNNLLDKRIDIIKAEIGALLFNLGKTHIGFNFWKKHFDNYSNEFKFSSYKDYVDKEFTKELESTNKGLSDFFSKLNINLEFKQKSEDIPITEIMLGGESSNDFVINVFFRGCENVNSGIDKGAPKEQLNKLWISNAFGTFKEDVKKDNFDDMRLCFFKRLWDKLSNLDNNLNNLTYKDWVEIRRFVFSEIKKWYSHLLSDSRFPVNDVTLWDQAYMSASLFKAAVAAMCLDKSKSDNYGTPKNIQWSVLGIQYDKLSLVDKSLKTHFISWYRENINNCDDEVKKLIEEKYTLGNEIYRDETGIYFIAPENINGNNEDDKLYKLNDDINAVKEDIIKIFEKIFNGEIYPAIFLTEPSRGTMNLAILVEKSKENFLKPCLSENFSKNILAKRDDNIGDKNEKDKIYDGLCKICVLRPGKKEDDIILCDICSDRKESKMREWLENIDSETIWTGDLQDKEGRIALVTLKFEMKEWLNGDFFNKVLINNIDWNIELRKMKETLMAIREVKKINGDDINEYKKLKGDESKLSKFMQDIDYILKNVSKKLSDEFVIDYNTNKYGKKQGDNIRNLVNNGNFEKFIHLFNYHIFDELAHEAYGGCKRRDENINDFIFQILLGPSIGDRWEDLIKEKLGDAKIDFENRKIYWDKLTDNDIEFLSKILLQFLVRKNPSPARLRRITETTLNFLNNIKKDLPLFMFNDDESKKEWRFKRIVWKTNNVKKGEYGEYRYKGLEFMSDGEGNVYLISSIEQAVDLIRKYDDKEKERKKEDIYNNIYNKIKSGETDWIKNKIENIEAVDEDKTEITLENAAGNVTYKSYLPCISIIDPTPTMWQFIVPAECVPQIIREVEKRYNREFKYVIGKLPMHIGVVIQDYKKPLYIGLKALRNIKRDIENFDDIKIKINAEKLKVSQKNGFHYINEYEQAEKLEDVYSLYEICDDGGKYKFYINPEKDSGWLDTTANKAESTKFCVYPNTFDFEFIDVNTRRNDIYYREGKRLTNEKGNRPYTLDKWRLFEEFFKYFSKEERKTKLQNLVSLLYSKLQDWRGEDEGLKQFMISSFVNILNLKEEKDKDQFAAIFGKESWNDFERSSSNEFETILKMFVDMYEFWHKALKKL